MHFWELGDAVQSDLRVRSGIEEGPRACAAQQDPRRCCLEWWLSAEAWLLPARAATACAPGQQPPATGQFSSVAASADAWWQRASSCPMLRSRTSHDIHSGPLMQGHIISNGADGRKSRASSHLLTWTPVTMLPATNFSNTCCAL